MDGLGLCIKKIPEDTPCAGTSSQPDPPLVKTLQVDLCRLCANVPDSPIEIYNAEGITPQLSEIINEYLPVKVSPEDELSLCCCSNCASTILSFHEFALSCVEAQKRLPVAISEEPKPIPIVIPPAEPDQQMATVDDEEGQLMDDDEFNEMNEDDESEEETKLLVPGTSDDTESKRDTKQISEISNQEHKHPKHKSKPHTDSDSSTRKQISEKRERMRNLIESSKVYIENQLCGYKCPECGYVFKTRSAFSTHQSIHTGEKSFCCHLCGKNFRTSTGLKVHIDNYHLKKRKYPCSYCDKVFGTKSGRDFHINIHTETRPFVCELCGKAFAQSSSLNVHKMYHTQVYRFNCDVCSKKFRRATELKIHNRTHTGERPYKCETCGASFIEKQRLKAHMRIHDTSKTFTCDICGNKFKQQKYLKNHLRNHRKAIVKVS